MKYIKIQEKAKTLLHKFIAVTHIHFKLTDKFTSMQQFITSTQEKKAAHLLFSGEQLHLLSCLILSL